MGFREYVDESLRRVQRLTVPHPVEKPTMDDALWLIDVMTLPVGGAVRMAGRRLGATAAKEGVERMATRRISGGLRLPGAAGGQVGIRRPAGEVLGGLGTRLADFAGDVAVGTLGMSGAGLLLDWAGGILGGGDEGGDAGAPATGFDPNAGGGDYGGGDYGGGDYGGGDYQINSDGGDARSIEEAEYSQAHTDGEILLGGPVIGNKKFRLIPQPSDVAEDWLRGQLSARGWSREQVSDPWLLACCMVAQAMCPPPKQVMVPKRAADWLSSTGFSNDTGLLSRRDDTSFEKACKYGLRTALAVRLGLAYVDDYRSPARKRSSGYTRTTTTTRKPSRRSGSYSRTTTVKKGRK